MRTFLRRSAVIGLLIGGFAVPQSATAQGTPAAPTAAEVDKLLAPIALYPDQLLAQMLMCAAKPAKVAAQIPALNELLVMRNKLTELLSKMEGNDKLEALLADVVANTDKAAALAKERGLPTGDQAPKTEGN